MKRRRLPEIPMDVMMEIFTRLPPKSLMRFKCVSKLWSSLICSRYFSERFLTVPSPRLYIFNHYHSVILSSAPDTTTSTTPSSSSSSFVHLYNLTTRQLVTLPAIKSYMMPSRKCKNLRSFPTYYFGHDPVNDLYKVICSISQTLISREITIISEYWVFVLKPGGSWKKVAPPDLVDFCPHVPIREGLSINGVIYYLAWIHISNIVVVSFDIKSEEFKMIRLPHKDSEALEIWIPDPGFIEYGGKATVFDYRCLRDNGMVDLWVLEDAGNKEWSRKTLHLPPSQLHLVKNITFKVNGATQNGKVILIPLGNLLSPYHFLCYDVKKNDMRKIEIKGIPDHWFHRESVFYLET
ncbi:hypothetical protein EUTSA_v10005397mg [Eutrema salsugineum]|uniref:F-box domain-containing protein n=1 Tax=Eutrema salsugineum TaxID=72664 RepID=V4K5J1_EUTSA|nr:hypothetical protein EUTSA_v10005397mg [Eutrema salsugineum]